MDFRGLWEATKLSVAETADGLQTQLRTAVSGDRSRLQSECGKFDLDLSYVTDSMIAMALPVETRLESTYRNSIEDVQSFLNSRHGDNYMVINVSERQYGSDWFGGRSHCLGWPDHHAPPLHRLVFIMGVMEAWLRGDAPQTPPMQEKKEEEEEAGAHTYHNHVEEESLSGDEHPRVVVVHCKAGKGRTGTVISSYMIHSGSAKCVEEALERFASKRSKSGEYGVTVPSQIRYVRYLYDVIHHFPWKEPVIRTLRRVTFSPVPNYDPIKGGVEFIIELVNMSSGSVLFEILGGQLHPSKTPSAWVGIEQPLEGDILMRVYHQPHLLPKLMMFRCQFHTAFIRGDTLRLSKNMLDSPWSGVLRDKRIPMDFSVELQFAPLREDS